MIALRFETDVARSISRVVAQATSASGKAQVGVSDPPAESGDFPVAPAVAAPTFAAGNAPPWLQKIVERFPLEQLNQRLVQLRGVQKAERSVPETGQSVADASDLERALGDLERELELRAGLIREQWAIRGPGLLAALTRQNGFQLLKGEVEVELVLPLTGGSAGVDNSGKAWMEALLHDVSFQFPETLRVGWLVARLGSASEDAAVQSLLNAAAEVDWLSPDPATETELRLWLGVGPAKSLGDPPLQAVRGSRPE